MPLSTPLRAVACTAAAALAAVALTTAAPAAPDARAASATKTVRLVFSGGHATDPRDGGRPVVLVAAALGVPTDVFRTAFRGVTPAGAGQEPEAAQVGRNKQALLAVLGPYGVTNEALDAASDAYRHNGSAGETWPQTAATGTAVVRRGRVVSVRIVAGGAGYSSAPRVRVPGLPNARIAVTVAYGRDVATNGRVSTLAIRHR